MLDQHLKDEEPLSVTVMVNDECEEGEYPVTVMFGTRSVGSEGCNIQQNVTNKEPLSNGMTSEFSIDATSFFRQFSDDEYCYVVALDGVPGNIFI